TRRNVASVGHDRGLVGRVRPESMVVPLPTPTRCSRRLLLSDAGALGLQALHWSTAATVAGCASDPVAARRVRLETWLDTHPVGTFDTAAGFQITLSSAELGLEHLYYVTGDPVGGSLSRFIRIQEAHAHPGHYSSVH